MYVRRGDLYLFERETGIQTHLTQTHDIESPPRFSLAGDVVIFERDEKISQFAPPQHGMWGKVNIAAPMDSTERYVSFVVTSSTESSKWTRAMDWITESGYTEELRARVKVGCG